MLKCFLHLVTLFILECFRKSSALSVNQLQTFCSIPNTVSIVGGNHRRLVTEGGRITLTCCMPGNSNGHDHEQLAWFDPRGKELSNHFANPFNKNQHSAYSIPDFRSSRHLVTMLVIQRFELTDTGGYTCRKANLQSTVKPAMVMLDLRPRLLADYQPLPPNNPEDSGAAVVAGRPVFVALEEGRQGEITCRINPNIPEETVHLTWYFQGRQLIAPSLALGGKELGQTQIPYTEPASNDFFNPQVSPMERELVRIAKESELLQSSRRYDMLHGRPVSIDPAELGIRILDDGQILRMERIDSRHSGIYLCKAEAQNPTWSPETSANDPPPTESGVIESPVLVQLQAIRGIVFSPPRMLPGSPREVPVPQTQGQQQYEYKKRSPRNQGGFAGHNEGPRYYMQPQTANSFRKPQQVAAPKFGKIRPVALEGGQLVLECQARGKPSPQLLWYRGGMGTNMLIESKALTFDQRIKEALQHLTLEDVQPQLGIMIANGEHLLPAIAGSGADTFSSGTPVSTPSPGDMNSAATKNNQLDRFELAVGVRKDDIGDPVITVSRLTINQLRPSDATRYTCLALLDLGRFGGSGNYTDVGSVFPEVVLRPRFIKSGTQMRASGFPGQNATLTCEAFGGLSNSLGLRLRLLRGNAVPELITLLTGSKQIKEDGISDQYVTDVPRKITKFGVESTDSIRFQPGPTVPESSFAYPGSSHTAYAKEHDYAALFGNDSLEVVMPGMDPRYQLSLTPDPRNPYMSALRLHVTDLRPEDNAFYACEALAGPHWRAIAPTSHEGPGRLTVWFPPTDVEPRTVLTVTENDETSREKTKGLVYGLSHQPSILSCQASGQPSPTWSWTGPETGPDVSLGNPDGPKGYKKIDYQDGELSISELKIAAGYWNVGLFGTYTCTATNRLGSGMAHLRLKMATHPSRPGLRACKVEAKMIELCVEPPKDTGGLPLTHYELRIQTHPRGAFYGPFAYLPGRRLLRLPHLIPGYYYRFALSAVSQAGRGPNAYLEVTTNRLTTPTIKMLTAQEYIEPTAYNVHWELPGTNGQEIDQYKINVRPVEVDYSMGEITGKPIGDWIEYAPVNPTCTKGNERMGTKPICKFRVDKLQPDKAYELELAGQNSVGFSEAQRVIFKTSTESGASGQMLNIPSYLRHTAGNTASPTKQWIHTTLFIAMLSFSQHCLLWSC